VCGICGIVGLGASEPALKSMVRRLAHRGPDHSETWLSEGVGLGHTRLSIVDLSPAGNQPMKNESGDIMLVANGEIYNNAELRVFLKSRGHRFFSGSDNETIIHLYEEEGIKGLKRADGMFACAIWDSRRRRLILARDRLGIKPLYYYQTVDNLIFASEIKSILAHPVVKPMIDPLGLRQYLTYENTFGSTTLHSGIRMVEPGQVITFENDRLTFDRFRKVEFPGEFADTSFSEACSMYRSTVEQAVERHRMSDVPVASYLSAGFDSPTVATLASRLSSTPLSTFTGSFGMGGWYDETTGALAAAKHIGSVHEEILITSHDLQRTMDDLIYSLDEPRMGPGSFSQYMVAKEAAQKVKVILTGHGGDELFAGYPVFKAILLSQTLKTDVLKTPGMVMGVKPAEWPHVVYFKSAVFRDRASRYFLPVIFSDKVLKHLLLPEVYEAIKPWDPCQALDSMLDGEHDPYRRLTLTYLKAYLPGLFVVEDKISMAHSLESRTPLSDNALVDFALTLPLKIKLHNGTLKAIPKQAMKDVLPRLLYQLPKKGFPTPIGAWFGGPLKSWIEERLLNPQSRIYEIFRKDQIERLVLSYFESWRRWVRPLNEIPTHRIWALLSMEAWLRNAEERLGLQLGIE
jgi:asparagine synthase (glutamine-hydrolysing)